jgi:hypothetical protein
MPAQPTTGISVVIDSAANIAELAPSRSTSAGYCPCRYDGTDNAWNAAVGGFPHGDDATKYEGSR